MICLNAEMLVGEWATSNGEIDYSRLFSVPMYMAIGCLLLMLTLLGLTNQTRTDFDDDVYRSISQVAWLSTVSLVGAVILLLMLVLPVGEFDKMPDGWYKMMYEVIFALTVFVCALLTATVVRLFMTIRHVISQVTPGQTV